MKYLRYDKYKKTGQDWLPEIPEGWETKSIKYCYTLFTGNSIADKENYSEESNTYPYISTRNIDIDTNEIDYSSGIFINKEDTSFRLSKENSVLMCIEGANAGKKIAFTKNDVCFVNKLCSFHSISHSNDNKYLFYFLQSVNFKEIFFSQMTGLIGGVSISLIKNIMIAFPAYFDQILIVRYLDQETSRIDKLIKEKTEFIELLKEQREALISRAVTKGLNPDVKMKDSGIEYIGTIPEHWEVRRLKTFYNIYSGSTPKSSVKEFWDEGILWATPSDISNTDKYIFYTRRTISQKGFESCGTSKGLIGDIILTTRAPIGNIAIMGNRMCINQGCRILSPESSNHSTEYLFRFLSIHKIILNSLGSGSTFLELSTDKLGHFQIPVPPAGEQKQITAYLEQKLNLSKEIETEIEKSIVLLKEKREALITAAVTGKIKIIEEMVSDN